MVRTTLGVVLALMVTGCEPVPPQSLEDVEIPPDFHFETTRAMELVVEVTSTVRADEPSLWLEVRKSNGVLIYHGAISEASGWQAVVRTQLPKHMSDLELTLTGDGWTDTATVTVDGNGDAFHRFQ